MKSNQNIVGITKRIGLVLAAWLALVIVLGSRGAFLRPAGTPPLPLLLGVLTPIGLFFAAFRFSKTFRDFVLIFDLRLATAIQAWRFAGFGFLALYAYHVLPGSFAWPAGVGDILIGVTAPWVMLALIRRPEVATSRWFVGWNILGILDLVTAVGSGGLNSLFARGIPGEITTRPMAELPLVLIPAFFVPILAMLHLSALFQAQRCAGRGDSINVALPATTGA